VNWATRPAARPAGWPSWAACSGRVAGGRGVPTPLTADRTTYPSAEWLPTATAGAVLGPRASVL